VRPSRTQSNRHWSASGSRGSTRRSSSWRSRRARCSVSERRLPESVCESGPSRRAPSVPRGDLPQVRRAAGAEDEAEGPDHALGSEPRRRRAPQHQLRRPLAKPETGAQAGLPALKRERLPPARVASRRTLGPGRTVRGCHPMVPRTAGDVGEVVERERDWRKPAPRWTMLRPARGSLQKCRQIRVGITGRALAIHCRSKGAIGVARIPGGGRTGEKVRLALEMA
jgi:hypothetical protein